MENKLLSSGEVCEISGLAPNTFDEWCRKGIVRPVEGGEGHGSHRRFTLMQTVGIVVAVKIRSSERGCVLSYVQKVIEAFEQMTEAELQKRFAQGGTHFVRPHHGKPILQGRAYDWVDVQQTFNDVMKKVAKLSRQPANEIGRSRGLSASK